MSNLNDSLSAYYALRQQKATELPAQLRQLQQQIAAQLQALQKQEQTFLTAQADTLDQICVHLATDARLLLSTSQFQEFVRDLLAQIKARRNQPSFTPQITPKPTKWFLHTLQDPLQVGDIERMEQTNPYDEGEFCTFYVIRMVIQLGQWQQVFDIPTATAQNDDPSLYTAYSGYEQWYEVAVCVQAGVERLPVAVSKQQRLAQELVCLMAYVTELFNLYSIAERVGFLPQLQGLENQDGELP